MQKRCRKIIFNDNKSDYETLLENSITTILNIERMRSQAIETFETINNLNFSFMKEIFTTKTNPKERLNDIAAKCHKTTI